MRSFVYLKKNGNCISTEDRLSVLQCEEGGETSTMSEPHSLLTSLQTVPQAFYTAKFTSPPGCGKREGLGENSSK